jgi:hypothetical protein
MAPARMCAAEGDCGPRAFCVAGRCLARGATPAIDTARRLLVGPVDVAYIRRGEAGPAPIATLGKAGNEGATILLRFSVPLPPEANVLEAYVVLERVTPIESDPQPLVLHAAVVVDPWDGRSVSWARQPRVQDVLAPQTRVSATAGPHVRLDVRAVVQRWRRENGGDFGIAVLADGRSTTGMAFALSALTSGRPTASAGMPPSQPPAPFEPHPAPTWAAAVPRDELVGPALELYVK